MKTQTRFASLSLPLVAFLSLLTILCLALGSTAFAGVIYADGPTNGTYNSVFIDGPGTGQGHPFGQSISDGFVAAMTGMGTEVFFVEWVQTLTVPTGVSYAISDTQNFGGTLTAGANWGTSLLCTDGTAFNGGICGAGAGYDVYLSHFSINHSFTATDTYWLTLSEATDTGGYGSNAWDINPTGLATCDFEQGTIVPGGGLACGYTGESFTITSGPGTTPEPSSLMLFGSGILGLAGVLRRRLMG